MCSNRKMKIKNVPIVIIETLTSKFVSLLSGMNISTRVDPIRLPSRKIQGRKIGDTRVGWGKIFKSSKVYIPLYVT